ncbi:MAG: patatin-like phospholipase family protein [Vicinamibacterales bacterium]
MPVCWRWSAARRRCSARPWRPRPRRAFEDQCPGRGPCRPRPANGGRGIRRRQRARHRPRRRDPLVRGAPQILIDVAVGTSMGGLIGGAFATGMDVIELERMPDGIDWDDVRGLDVPVQEHLRRKTDARVFPSRLELASRAGAADGLNAGEHVELLLGHRRTALGNRTTSTAPDASFRCMAVDSGHAATEVVLGRGSLVQAMRATMSIPLVFPPVTMDGRVLVDGGAMNNVPADVAKALGADRVVAINVGDLADRESVDYSLLGLAGATIDAMMRASTKSSMAAADIVVDVPLKAFGSLDWRRGEELVRAGYDAAEAMRDELLPLAVDEGEYGRWAAARAARRRHSYPVPAFVGIEGFAAHDERRLGELLARHVGIPFDLEEVESDLGQLTGLDRYETVTWSLVNNEAGDPGLIVRARPKAYAPPFMMLGLNLENTTSTDFRVTATARYLAYGVVTSGSELRMDGTLGSNPAAGLHFYQPIAATPLFVAPSATLSTEDATNSTDDRILARYGITTYRGGADVGVNLGAFSDLRVGAYLAWVDAKVDVGDLNLPELRGRETGLQATWRYDGQDSPVVPSRGLLASVRLRHVLDGPDGVLNGQVVPIRGEVTQLSGEVNRFWSLGERNRVFLAGGFGTSFDGDALPTSKFILGSPLRLGGYRSGELRGNHYVIGTGGYLRQLGRLPDFMGGPVFAGGWVENGDAFEDWDLARVRTNASVGLVLDTLVGPVMLAGSAGFDGRWRTYIGIGRIFR